MAIKASNQISLIDLTDAYSVIMTNEAHTFIGSTTGVASSQSTTTQFVALCGSDTVPCTIGEITTPTGLTAVSDGKSPSPTVTISASTALTTGGTINIPVTIDGDITINKTFSYAIAYKGSQGVKGDQGKGVSGVTITYQSSTSNTTPPTGTWSASIPSVPAGSYLWTKFVYSYTDGTSSDPAYTVAKQGSTGATGAGAIWYTGTAITGTSTTDTVFASSGVASAKVGDMYLNTSTGYTYRCTVAGAASAAKWVYAGSIKGNKGDPGADAITLSVTSSGGTIFKNTAIATTLTAHVYKAGKELTSSEISALGTIKWYKDGSTTAAGTGLTLSITAGDVDDKASYVAQLEG